MEDRYEDLVQHMGQGVACLTASGAVTVINPGARRMLGIGPDAAIDPSAVARLWDLVQDDGSACPRELHPASITLKTGQPVSHRVLGAPHAEGGVTWLSLDTRPLFGPGRDAPHAVIVSFSDVSRWVAAARAMRISEEKHRLLLEESTDPIFSFETDGTYAYVNKAFAAPFGKTPEQIIGRRIWDVFPQDEADKRFAVVKDVFANGVTRVIEVRVPTAQGDQFYVTSVKPILDGQGRVATVICISKQITERKQAEEAARQSISLFKATLESTADGLLAVDLRGNVLACNQRFLDIWGIPQALADSGDDRRLLDFVLSKVDDAQVFLDRVKELYDRPLEEGYDVLRFKDGRVIERFSRPQFVDEEPTGRVWSFRDVTERHNMERSLKESELRHRLFLENLPDPVVFYDMTGRALYLNPAFEKTFGWKRTELIGRRVDFIPPGEMAATQNAVAKMMSGEAFISLRTKRLTKSGAELDIHLTTAPFHNQRGEQVGNVVQLRDISDLARAQRELSASERRNLAILEASPDPMVVYDMEGRVTYLNPAFTSVFGWSLEERMGHKLDDFVPRESWPETLEMIAKVKAGQNLFSAETRRLAKDGRLVDVNISCAVIKDKDGSPRGSVINLRDISRTKRLEAELRHAQKMEALGTLAGGIAHDFNNILAAILGFSELALAADRSGSGAAQPMTQVIRSAERARDLVRQILAFSRKMEGNPKPLDLNREVRRALEVLERTLPKMVDIQHRLADDLNPVNADSTQMQQILLNLAANAADAMPEGGRLLVETANAVPGRDYHRQHPEMADGAYVMLRVSDNGQGMDSPTLEQVFDPFFTTKELGKGTGLGLSTVYGVVKGHNGHIACESEPGRGTVFTIHLPAHTDDLPASEGEEADDGTPPWGDENILWVDDEPDLLEMGVQALQGAGYSVMTAANGEEALKIYRRHWRDVDLVVLDLGMPGMGGRRALKEMLAVNPRVKVLVASGYSAQGQISDTLTLGAADYLAKPFRLADLLATVRRVLDGEPDAGADDQEAGL